MSRIVVTDSRVTLFSDSMKNCLTAYVRRYPPGEIIVDAVDLGFGVSAENAEAFAVALQALAARAKKTAAQASAASERGSGHESRGTGHDEG